ncbi:MAG: high-potential iron-sulfur protein [Halobacteriovoraceae bacterium]|nr:high-potential iron-sulfur protein [Halobacteriovoraceae bacterium]
MMEQKNSRRSFFKLAFGAIALAPLFRVASVFAEAAMPKSDKIKKKMINDKTSKRLKYVADAAEAKKLHASGDKNFKKFKEGSNCTNCKFYKADKGEPEWGKCTMAANRYVSGKGWCKSYRAKK